MTRPDSVSSYITVSIQYPQSPFRNHLIRSMSSSTQAVPYFRSYGFPMLSPLSRPSGAGAIFCLLSAAVLSYPVSLILTCAPMSC